MAGLKSTRDTLHQDASPDPKGHGHDAKATAMSLKRTTSNRAGGRCDIPTPKKSPVSWSCTEEMPSSVESEAGPSIRGGSWGTKRRWILLPVPMLMVNPMPGFEVEGLCSYAKFIASPNCNEEEGTRS